MRVTLTPEQEAWLRARFSVADEASLESAARQLIDERIAEWEADDLDWAKPMIDEALGGMGRGEVLSHEEHKTRIAAHLAEFKG